MDIAEELSRLVELHRDGALTDEEFAQAKQAVLSRAKGAEPSPAQPPGIVEPTPASPAPTEPVADYQVAGVPAASYAPLEPSTYPSSRKPLWLSKPVTWVVAGVVLLLVVGGIVTALALGGDDNESDGARITDDMYSAANVDEFLAADPKCGDLVLWYEILPASNNADIADRFWSKCASVPPPVKTFNLAPWDNEKMFSSLLLETFPTGDPDTVDDQLVHGKLICAAPSAGMSREDINTELAELGRDVVQNLITVSLTTLCPEHRDTLLDSTSTATQTATSDEENAQILDEKWTEEYGDAWLSPSIDEIIETAQIVCYAIIENNDPTGVVVWSQHFDLPSDSLDIYAEVGGNAVMLYCPEAVDVIADYLGG